MATLSLVEAFATYGGKPANRLHSLSAVAGDGTAIILGCIASRFGHPAAGVLRYESKLPPEPNRAAEAAKLGEHLTLARDGKLPVRMIIIQEKPQPEGNVKREVHVRTDLIGSVVSFDGDTYVVDFIRPGMPAGVKRPEQSQRIR
ncbi:MAG: hypothetical protein WDO68_06580 [Gammaproteobacteria bacterium]